MRGKTVNILMWHILISVIFLTTGIHAIGKDRGATTANRWHEAEEIYYILGGVEEGVTLDDILNSDYVSNHYPEALLDDVGDILAAEKAGLITLEVPGMFVLCPIISEEGADAPGSTQLSKDFTLFPETF